MGDGLHRRAVAGIGLLMLVLLAACAEGLGFAPTPGYQPNAFPVDTVFKEFYQTLGGQEVLGPAISTLEIRENLQCQYTERALMCFNPLAADISRFGLYPLGRQLGVQEDAFPVEAQVSTETRVVDGIPIYEKFIPLYDRLFGERYVGRPLTQLRINQDLQRAEQFFENVGFYQNLGDPNGPVYLISYGAYLCGGSCSSRLNEYWSIVKSSMTDQPFAQEIARLGGPGVFGSLLLKPEIAPDGYLQQVYSNAIFYSPVDEPSQVRLRPLPKVLGYEMQPPAEKIVHDQLVYYEINGGMGHNVPKPFDEFVASHGGRDLAGNPISEVIRLDSGLYQQCFDNYCLIYDPSAADVMKVRMAPLGKAYLQKYPPAEKLEIHNMFSPDRIVMAVSVDKPTLNDNEEQVIRLLVQQKETGQTLERVEATLLLQAPGQTAVRLSFAPTDASGMSVVVVPPQPDTANGTRFSYQVCLNLPSEQPICQRGSYLIWNVQQ